VSLIVLDKLALSFGERTVFENLNLRIGDGDRVGLIGANGSGKTTLLRIIAGQQEPDKGQVKRASRVRIGYLPQDWAEVGKGPLLEFVLTSVPGREQLHTERAECEADLDAAKTSGDEAVLMDLAERVADIHERLDHFERYYTEHEAARILAGLGFASDEHDRDLEELSGGWQMRAALAALLFQQPDLLLLDEPTNHLDLPSVTWFGDFLESYKRSFYLISHDREFLNEQIERVVSFEPEDVRQYSGNYEQYLRQRTEEEAVLEARARNVEREREKLERFIARNRARKDRARGVQSRMKTLEKLEKVEVFEKRKVMRFRFPPTERAVTEVVRVEGMRKAFGDHVVFPGIDLTVRRGEKIGIIGVNGAGKTTLLKMMAGELRPDSGKISIGGKVQPGYFAQHHAETLHDDMTVYEEVFSACPDTTVGRVRSILGAFLFSGDDVDKRVSVLSGGERARVALARLMINPGNLLLMDEPTNHLDLESSESLAESLSTFDGTLVFVSHNRSLIRKLATVIWNVEEGRVEPYDGTLDEYMYSCRLRWGEGGQEPAEPAEGDGAEQATPRSDREKDKERKRREAQLRNERYRVLGPVQKRVAELEELISRQEQKQQERSERLSDPAVYDDEKVRLELVVGYQKAARRIEQLTSSWEEAVEELDEAEAKLAAAEAELESDEP